MRARAWAEGVGLAVAACGTLAILGFYVSRLGLPLPLFPADEAAYLIRAIWPDGVVAANPYVAAVNNGVHLSVIRAVYEAGLPFIVGDRLVNAAAYLVGLALLWRASTARVGRVEQIALGLLALGFPYYRFAFSNLAEGLFVGVLALLCLATGRWWRSRPLVHAVVGGALAAALVLVKPNGMATVAALAAVAGLDAAVSGGWRRLPVRIALFAATFFAVGNLIQWAADEPVTHPLSFFVADLYGAALHAGQADGAAGLGALEFLAMVSAAAVMAGAPIVIGLTDLFQRWRAARGGFTADGRDLTFVLLVLSLAATLVMVTLFTMQIASTITETKRLWGRYFEFFAPMIWLAAAPMLARPVGRWTPAACGAVTLLGLAGLLASFQAGVVLFPWDASTLTAFFAADPVRIPLSFPVPYRTLAAAACGIAAIAFALRARPALAGLGLILALGALSTHLDKVWLAPMVAQRLALERDVRAFKPMLPPPPAALVLLAPDANDGHLGFLRLDARPRVLLGPLAQTAPGDLSGAQAVVVSGPGTPPGGPWVRTYRGDALSVFQPALAAAPSP
jgi:hypothetical protein